jgi:hypothetical protein
MAEIIQLPTAAPMPVEQHARRGRLPKTVATIAGARSRRCREAMIKKAELLELAKEARSDARELLTEVIQMNVAEEIDGLMMIVSRPGKTPLMCAVGTYRAKLELGIVAAEEFQRRLEHLANQAQFAGPNEKE